MLGSIRSVRVTLSSFSSSGPRLFLISQPTNGAAAELPGPAPARDDTGKNDATTKAGVRPAENWANPPGFLGQPGDDPPRPFVPLRPSTVDDRRRIEAVRLDIAARALEDHRKWDDAVALLQQAPKLDPDSVAIARRLGRIYVGALGRPDLALQYGKRVLAVEPGDTDTLTRLVDYYNKNEPAGAEALLNEVLANPKLDAHAPGRLLAQFELGKLYSGRLNQPNKAADAFAKVIDALDDKSSNRLSASDQLAFWATIPPRPT